LSLLRPALVSDELGNEGWVLSPLFNLAK